MKTIIIKLNGRLKATWSVMVSNTAKPFNCRPVHIGTGAINSETYWFANEGLLLSKLNKRFAIDIISLYPHDEGVEELMNMITPTQHRIKVVEEYEAVTV